MQRLSLALAMIFVLMFNVISAKGDTSVIENGKKVKFDYTLIVNEDVIDTSKGKAPLEYVQGAGQIIPGLEKQMEGMMVGDEKTVTVLAEDAYGPVNDEAFQEIPKTMFPPDFNIQIGLVVPLQDNEGKTVPAIIHEDKDEVVVFNFNHPLAGKDLTFAVKIVDIQ